jgi:oligopeptidase B
MSPNPKRTLPSLSIPAGGQAEFAEADGRVPAAGEMEPPVARMVPRVHTIHGESRIDEYHWLRNRDDPEVLAYLEAENRYTRSVMGHTEPLQELLYQELRGRIKEADLSVPCPQDGWLYYSRTETGQQYPIHCRRRDAVGADEEILLDLNRLAAGHAYFRMGAFEVSPDHRLLAYSVDTTGAEAFTVFLKDLTTGQLLAETIERTSPTAAWANDSRTLFYVVLDDTHRPSRLFRHRVGANPVEDVLVHFEPDEAFFLDINRLRSGRFLVLDLASHATSEVRYASADHPEDSFRVVEPRRHGVEYAITHHGDHFYIVTNDDAPNFRLVSTPVERPGRTNWAPVLEYRPEVKLDSAEAFADHLVIWERMDGLRRIRVVTLATGEQHLIPFPEPVYTVRPEENLEFTTSVFRFSYTSLVTPASVVDYDMAGRTWTVRKQTEVLGGYDPSLYRSERRFAAAPDGTRVPVSLVYRLPLERDGRRPLLLQGYGSYGYSFEPAFSSNLLSLLERGYLVAIAHVRGGEEMGRAWYESGKLLSKQNTFSDFIAAAEHLIAEGYTSPDRLAINGGSAGGLLMGAVTNQRPDLFQAVIAEVPFVDVVNTMLDATLPLTVIEYDEWGNPNDRASYEYIRTYSPYDNVASRDYPHILVTAGLNDPRVAYWEPAKWTARLRARKTDRNRLLLRTNMGAGHGGASGRYDYLREVAFKYAFLLDVVGQQ